MLGLERPMKLSRIRPRKQISLGTLFGIVALVLYVGYYVGKKSGHVQQLVSPPSSTVNMELKHLQQENEVLRQQISNEKHNYEIQLEAQKNLSHHIKTLEQQNSELSQDVALYERIRGTPHKKTIEIKTFHIFSTSMENTFRYLLLLSKNENPEQLSQGTVQMKIFGRIGSDNIELPVRYADSSYQGLNFKFRNFQELSGELSFPQGFVPQSVSFEIKPLIGTAFQQEFPWDNQHIYPDQT